MPLKAAVQGASAEIGDRVPQASENVVQREKCSATELDDDRFLGRGRTLHFGFGHIGASEISVRLRNLRRF
jgi:hypothetical protein